MEVLFVTHKYPPSVGGMEKQSFELTQGMKRLATVHLLCCDGSESKVRFFWLLKKRIRALLQAHPGISIIHFNDGLAAAFCSGADDFPGIQRSVTLHGLDVVFPNSFFQHRILPRFNAFRSVIAVSQATAQACIERGIDPSKVVVIPNGVDHDIASYHPSDEARKVFELQYQPAMSNKITLLMMGRPVLRKGFSWLLQSVLPQLGPRFQVLIIGPFQTKKPLSTKLLGLLPEAARKQLELLFGLPSDADTLRTLLAQPEYAGRVTHLGKLPFEDILQIMSAAQAFVMPNIRVAGDMEGFGLVCLEASLRGLPVFAARLEGITDAIQDQKNGWLLPSGDASAWVTALSAIEPNIAGTKEFGQQAKAYTLANFGWEKMVAAYQAHFLAIQ